LEGGGLRRGGKGGGKKSLQTRRKIRGGEIFPPANFFWGNPLGHAVMKNGRTRGGHPIKPEGGESRDSFFDGGRTVWTWGGKGGIKSHVRRVLSAPEKRKTPQRGKNQEATPQEKTLLCLRGKRYSKVIEKKRDHVSVFPRGRRGDFLEEKNKTKERRALKGGLCLQSFRK